MCIYIYITIYVYVLYIYIFILYTCVYTYIYIYALLLLFLSLLLLMFQGHHRRGLPLHAPADLAPHQHEACRAAPGHINIPFRVV